jgi:membrane dipeptidase
VFDGHNDTVTRLREVGGSYFDESVGNHLSPQLAKQGGLIGGFFAIWIPDIGLEPDFDHESDADMVDDAYKSVETMPPLMPTAYAQEYALSSLGRLIRIEKESGGSMRIVRTAADFERAIADGVLAMELHLEGAEPIDPGLDALEVYYAAGVRSIGLVWSRSNIFGHGVPFDFPGSPDSGPGLTDAGKALVRACNELGIMLDVSHLNEKGFWDLAGISDRPIVATHSAAHAICQTPRNLTDKQIDAIGASGGVIGVNFHVGFINPIGDAATAENTSLTFIADHLDYVVNRIGIDHVALGSDFDGARMPGDLANAAGLSKLMDEIASRGYDDAAMAKIGYQNWHRVFRQTWQA